MLSAPGPAGVALLAILAAVWLIAAIVAIVIGSRRAAEGRRALERAHSLGELLAVTPVAPILVYAGGGIDADARIADWLGLARPPETLNELAGQGGFAPAALVLLKAEIEDAFRSGGRFAINLDAGGRLLQVRGQPHVGTAAKRPAVLLWLSDVTEAEEQVGRLTIEVDRLGRAYDGLAALIEAAPFPIWHRGSDLRLSFVNGAYVRAVEAADASDVVARSMELIEADSDHGPRTSAGTTRDSGVATIRTVPAIVAGQLRMMRVIDVPLGDAGIAGYAVDVQDVEDARADLGLFVQAQRDMLDRLSAGVAQFAGDDGLIFFNRHFARLFAIDPEWLADRPEFDHVLERMREMRRAPESRDFPGWKSERRAWFKSTEPAEENWLLPGGTHLRVVAQPLPDRGLLLIFEDRTEQLQMASARDTLLRVRTAMFDNLFEAIGVFAGDGRLQLWNSRFRELWGLDQDELVRHPRVDALVQSIAPKLLDPARAGLIRNMVRIATVERQQRSGRISLLDGRHFEFAAVPLPDGNAMFALLDITASRGIEAALRDRNEALEEANSLKSAFVASMSYELRVPLTSIAGFAEMLASGDAGVIDTSAQDYVDAILSAVGRLRTLIGNEIDPTQSEPYSLPMVAEPIEIAALATEAVERAMEPMRAAALTLASDIPADCGMISGDRARLGRCLDHLLRNAAAYTPPGGRVLLRCQVVDQWVEMIVSDNGNGIPAAHRERIFDRFSRGSFGTPGQEQDGDDDRSSLGLGLPLARQVAEAHGGTLILLSELGRGTSVIVHLPLIATTTAEARAGA